MRPVGLMFVTSALDHGVNFNFTKFANHYQQTNVKTSYFTVSRICWRIILQAWSNDLKIRFNNDFKHRQSVTLTKFFKKTFDFLLFSCRSVNVFSWLFYKSTGVSKFNPLRDSGTYVYHDCDCSVTKALL